MNADKQPFSLTSHTSRCIVYVGFTFPFSPLLGAVHTWWVVVLLGVSPTYAAGLYFLFYFFVCVSRPHHSPLKVGAARTHMRLFVGVFCSFYAVACSVVRSTYLVRRLSWEILFLYENAQNIKIHNSQIQKLRVTYAYFYARKQTRRCTFTTSTIHWFEIHI